MKLFAAFSACLLAGGLCASPAHAQTLPPTGNLFGSAFSQFGLPPAPPVTPTPAAASTTAPGPAPAAASGAGLPTESAASGMMAPPPAPAASLDPSKKPESYVSTNVDGKYIALTFDDGPDPTGTPKLLKILADRGAKATFFVVGTNAKAYSGVLRQIVAGGNEIGNHSWNHPQLPKLTVEAADKQIADTNAAIEAATGQKTIYLRPPYGAMTASLQHHLHEKFGLTAIYWSVDPLDWKDRNSDKVYARIMNQVRPGAIVLAHDIHPTTVAAMPRVLDELKAQGYKFVTVSELIAMHKPEAPKVASAVPFGEKKKSSKSSTKVASKSTTTSAAKPASSGAGVTGSVKPAAKPSSSTARTQKPHNGGLY